MTIEKTDNGNIVFQVEKGQKFIFKIGGKTVLEIGECHDNSQDVATKQYVDDNNG